MYARTKLLALLLSICTLNTLAACTSLPEPQEDPQITIRLTAPLNSFIEDFDTNLYLLWLEEQTGLNIEITWLPSEDAEQVVKQQLHVGHDLPDAYIGFGSLDIFQKQSLQRYAEQGVIIPLDNLIEQYGTHTRKLYEELPEYHIRPLMTSTDGHIYFMPGFSASTITQYRQTMWVNQEWLDTLNLNPPTTTEEFREMLLAFKNNDPNGNGIPDEIPMSGTESHYSKQPYDYLFNAFIYNDINNSRLILEHGKVGFAPVREEWRDALQYMHGLYDEGLYSPLSFTQDDQQLKQLANDTRDVLGAFLSPGITLTVLQNSPEMMARYVGIGPLTGPVGVKLSTVFTPIPKPNGVITSACEYPEEVFQLFDLMLSEEACLIGRYGEKGIDWEEAGPEDVSIYGTPATIRIINQIWNTPQNKHLMQIGPYVSRPKFSGGVTWNGSPTDGEYMNAQAPLLYQDHAPAEYIKQLSYTPEESAAIQDIKSGIEAHVDQTIIDFITGRRDIDDDSEWKKYLKEFDTLRLQEFLKTAQTVYNRG